MRIGVEVCLADTNSAFSLKLFNGCCLKRRLEVLEELTCRSSSIANSEEVIFCNKWHTRKAAGNLARINLGCAFKRTVLRKRKKRMKGFVLTRFRKCVLYVFTCRQIKKIGNLYHAL